MPEQQLNPTSDTGPEEVPVSVSSGPSESDSEEGPKGESKFEYCDSDDSEERDYDCPKYWNSRWSEVTVGAETRHESLKSLDVLCGKYHWIYNLPDHFEPGRVDYPPNGNDDDDDASPGYLILSWPKGEPATPENLSGKINYFGNKGHFTGATLDKDETCCWEINQIEWTLSEDFMENENKVTALKVCDDSGNPFINVSINCGWMGCSQWWTDVIGKRLLEGQKMPVTLTPAEMERLGMNSTRKEVAVKGWKKMKRREKKKKFRTEAEFSNTLKRKIESDDDDDRENKTSRKI